MWRFACVSLEPWLNPSRPWRIRRLLKKTTSPFWYATVHIVDVAVKWTASSAMDWTLVREGIPCGQTPYGDLISAPLLNIISGSPDIPKNMTWRREY
ncbi:hypothetical protein RRF57_009597 [Xylaria bambusicola]|uniref:Uncharacterized protein n=1 Tax=Xylaria bambusicola TaxID=326684 RepID=A0AAN7UQH7_9PEZI